MIVVPIANSAPYKARFPFFTLLAVSTCILIHVAASSARQARLDYEESVLRKRVSVDVEMLSLDHGRRLGPSAQQRRVELPGAVEPQKLRQLEVQDWTQKLALRSDPEHGSAAPVQYLSYAFAHGGWLHLAGNVLFLILFGVPIESRFGFRRTSSLFIASAMSGALLFALLNQGQSYYLVGASGAVAGLMGTFLIHFSRARFTLFYFVLLVVYPVWGTFQAPAYAFLPLWLGVEVLETVFDSAVSGVAHGVHVGGFLMGLLVGGIWMLPIFRVYDRKSSEEHRERRLRAALALLQKQLSSEPGNRELLDKTLDAALAVPDLKLAGELLGDWILAETDPAAVVQRYRDVREALPTLLVAEKALIRVYQAARKIESHQTLVEVAGRIAQGLEDPKRIGPLLVTAARAQEAMGRKDLAAATRSMLWEAGYDGSSAQDPPGDKAGEKAGAQSRVPAARGAAGASNEENIDPSRCKVHNLRALGKCRRCGIPVCAACSSTTGQGQRICRSCRELDAVITTDGQSLEAMIRGLASAWKVLAALTLALGVAIRFAPPDLSLFFPRWLLWLVVGLLVHATLTGFVLGTIGPRTYVPSLILNGIGLLSFPIGSLLGALGLLSLFKAEVRELYRPPSPARHLRSPSQPPRAVSWGKLLYRGSLAVLCFAAVLLAVRLGLKRSNALAASQWDQVSLPSYAPWRVGQRFILRSFRELEYSSESLGTVHARSHLWGRGEVLTLSDDGTPLRLRLSVEELAAETPDAKGKCKRFRVLTRRDGWTPDNPRQNTLESAEPGCSDGKLVEELLVLVPRWPTGTLDGMGVFVRAERDGPLSAGAKWSASGPSLETLVRPTVEPIRFTNEIEGSLELLNSETCGWNTCLSLRRLVRGRTGYAEILGLKVQGGLIALETSILIPTRGGTNSFMHEERAESVMLLQHGAQKEPIRETSVTRWEVMADGEYAAFPISREGAVQ